MSKEPQRKQASDKTTYLESVRKWLLSTTRGHWGAAGGSSSQRAELGAGSAAARPTNCGRAGNMASRHKAVRQDSALSTSSQPLDILEHVEGGRYARSISQVVEGGGGGVGVVPAELVTLNNCTSPGVRSYNSAFSYDNSAYTYATDSTDFEAQSHRHNQTSQKPYPSQDSLLYYPGRRWCLIMSMLTLLFLSCTLLTLTLCLAGPIHRRNASGSGESDLLDSDILCQPCVDLVLSDDPRDDFTDQFDKKLDESGTELCCARNRTQFNTLMEVIAQREVRQREIAGYEPRRALPPGNFTGFLPAASSATREMAHVFLDKRPGSSGSRTRCDSAEDFTTLRDWSFDSDTAFVRSGVTLDWERGRFRISRTGYYVVYLRLMYHGIRHHSSLERSGEDHFEFLTFSHRIKRSSFGGLTTTLLEDTRTAFCDLERSGVACHVSMEIAQQKLRKGQEIYVEVNQCTLLKADRKSSYFGLYRVSS